MAIDLETRQHICYGLFFGSGCDSCKKKYPHLLAKTPEEIQSGIAHLVRVEQALTAEIDRGNGSAHDARSLNDFTFGTPVSELPRVTPILPAPTLPPPRPPVPGQLSTGSPQKTINLAKVMPGFVRDMLDVPYTAPATMSRWATALQFFRRPQKDFVVPSSLPRTTLVVPNVRQVWIGDLLFPRQGRSFRPLGLRLRERVSRFFKA